MAIEDDDEPAPAGHRLDAIFTNRFNVRFQGDGLVRLVFADAIVGKKGGEHTALIMKESDAAVLAETVLRLRAELRSRG